MTWHTKPIPVDARQFFPKDDPRHRELPGVIYWPNTAQLTSPSGAVDLNAGNWVVYEMSPADATKVVKARVYTHEEFVKWYQWVDEAAKVPAPVSAGDFAPEAVKRKPGRPRKQPAETTPQ